MALLRCDECGSSDTNTYGSWSSPVKILCGKCAEKRRTGKVMKIYKGNGEDICLELID